eukprot:10132398-Prorocentrum_lima.AAC.1
MLSCMQACRASFADFTPASIEVPRAESPLYMKKFMEQLVKHSRTCTDCKAKQQIDEGYGALAKWEDTVADWSFHWWLSAKIRADYR